MVYLIWYIVVFGLYILFLIWTNVKSVKQTESLEDYTTGGHRMGLFLGTGTTTATWVSAASVLGIPGYLYSSGVSAVIGWMAGWAFGGALIPLVAYKIRRPKSPARTFPEYIRMRFEPFAKKSPLQAIVGFLMFIGYLLLVNIQVNGFGIVFASITGIDYKIAIFGFLIFIMITSIGGFWSIAGTDTLNSALIAVGCIAASVTVVVATGGVESMMNTLANMTAPTYEGGPALEKGVLLTPTGTFGLGALMSIFISNSMGTPASPHWVTRQLAPQNIKVAILQISWTLVTLLFIWVPLLFLGLGAKALIPSLPESKTTDYVIPMVLQEYTPDVIAAVMLVAISAAAVSTANSMLLHCGTSLYYDVYLNIFPKTMTDRSFKNWMRGSVFGIALVAVLLAINPPWFMAMGYTYIYGGFGAAFFLVVFLGLYWKRMNRAGAYVSVFVGALMYIYAEATDTAIPAFVVAVACSLVATLIAVYTTKKAPLEAYEPYFHKEISKSTKETMEQTKYMN